ncbi:hypothetical protein [Methanoplanus limicola]|uniref:Peptidase C39-like domain-containing protein n=1 Tax=Methanoplanus limicola DSM 2279 TaxID=937775 RepID=H1Z019_9EURY|nr:hypothetical protein [Methanoplanus limicola]EHQ35226.1 hypothetical protein Metlim_1115 [Methanoplanus limicola DSM 2279]
MRIKKISILLLISSLLFFISISSAELELRAPIELDEKTITEYEVIPDIAYQAALLEVTPYIERDLCCEYPDTWNGAYVKRSNPLKVYDISGEILFYEFDIVRDNAVLGKVRSSANKLIGYPAPVIDCSPNTEIKANLSNYTDYFNNQGYHVMVVGSYYGNNYLFVNCSDSDKESFIFDTWWNKELSVDKFKSYYKNYPYDPKEAVDSWNDHFPNSVGCFTQLNESLNISKESDSRELVLLTEENNNEKAERVNNSGLSVFTVLMVFVLLIFRLKKF